MKNKSKNKKNDTGTATKSVIWPYAVKTVAIGGMPSTFTVPYPYAPAPSFNTQWGEMALEIFPPLYVYKPAMLFMRLNYTFNSVIPSQYQILEGIIVRDTPSPYISTYGSTVETYLPLNIQADANRNINIGVDLSSILTGRPTNVVFLRFNVNCSEDYRSGGDTNGDTMNLWKLDLIYQTIGIRDEQ